MYETAYESASLLRVLGRDAHRVAPMTASAQSQMERTAFANHPISKLIRL